MRKSFQRSHIPKSVCFCLVFFFSLPPPPQPPSPTVLKVPVLTSCLSVKKGPGHLPDNFAASEKACSLKETCDTDKPKNMVLCLCVFALEKGWSPTGLRGRHSAKWQRKLAIKQCCHCKLLWTGMKSSSSFGAQPGLGLRQVVIVPPCC